MSHLVERKSKQSREAIHEQSDHARREVLRWHHVEMTSLRWHHLTLLFCSLYIVFFLSRNHQSREIAAIISTFHLYEIFICMTFASVWDFHLYEIFICMRFSSVWGFHLYEIFICMRFSSVGFICGFYLWVLSVGFICGFYLWVLSVGFICGFYLWV